MIIKCKVRRRGKTLWAIFPKSVVESEHIKEHDKLNILIVNSKRNVLKDII